MDCRFYADTEGGVLDQAFVRFKDKTTVSRALLLDGIQAFGRALKISRWDDRHEQSVAALPSQSAAGSTVSRWGVGNEQSVAAPPSQSAAGSNISRWGVRNEQSVAAPPGNPQHESSIVAQQKTFASDLEILDPSAYVQNKPIKKEKLEGASERVAPSGGSGPDETVEATNLSSPQPLDSTQEVQTDPTAESSPPSAEGAVDVTFTEPSAPITTRVEEASESAKLRQELASTLDAHSSEMQSWQREKGVAHKKIVDLEEQLGILTQLAAGDKNQLHEAKQKMEKELAEKLAAAKKSMQNDKKQLEDKCSTLSGTIKQLEGKAQQQRKTLKENHKLKLAGVRSSHAAELQTLTEKNKSLEANVTKLTAANEQHQASMTAAKKKFMFEMKSSSEKNVALKKQVAALEKEKKELVKKVAASKNEPRKEKTVMKGDVNSLRKENKRLEERIASITTSKDALSDSFVLLNNSSRAG
ncbi:MAG: hypothetical protein SGARI_000202 [Bacillariaceae sp.]